MPITLSGGTLIYRTLNAASGSALLADFISAIEDAGWTELAAVPAYNYHTLTANPANTQIVIIDGETFTAKTTPAGGNDFQIDADYTVTAQNLAAIITANSTNFTAEWIGAGRIRIIARTSGATGNNKEFANGLGNGAFTSTRSFNGGVAYQSHIYDNGLSMCLVPFIDQSDQFYLSAISPDFVVYPNNKVAGLTTGAGLSYQCVINRLAGCVWRVADPDTSTGAAVIWGVPRIYDRNKAAHISAVTDASGEFQITTTEPHGLQDLMSADLADSGVADGFWNSVSVVDENNIILTGSTYASGWTEGGLVAAPTKLCRAFFLANGGGVYGFRGRPLRWETRALGSDGCFVCTNSTGRISLANSSSIEVLFPKIPGTALAPRKFGGVADGVGFEVGWRYQTDSESLRLMGFLPGFMLLCASLELDTEQAEFQDGNTWVVIGTGSESGYLSSVLAQIE